MQSQFEKVRQHFKEACMKKKECQKKAAQKRHDEEDAFFDKRKKQEACKEFKRTHPQQAMLKI